MTSSPLQNVGDAIYSAHHKTKFNPKHIFLSYDQTTDLKIRAQFANITGDDRAFVDRKARINPVHGLGAYYLEVIKEETSPQRLLNPQGSTLRPHSRPGIRDEYVALIAMYPQHARKYRLVCINSELFYGDMHMSLVAFEWKGENFETGILPKEPRLLLPGDAVIFLK